MVTQTFHSPPLSASTASIRTQSPERNGNMKVILTDLAWTKDEVLWGGGRAEGSRRLGHDPLVVRIVHIKEDGGGFGRRFCRVGEASGAAALRG